MNLGDVFFGVLGIILVASLLTREMYGVAGALWK